MNQNFDNLPAFGDNGEEYKPQAGFSETWDAASTSQQTLTGVYQNAKIIDLLEPEIEKMSEGGEDFTGVLTDIPDLIRQKKKYDEGTFQAYRPKYEKMERFFKNYKGDLFELEKQAKEEAKKEYLEAEEILQNSDSITGSLVGGLTGSLHDPWNIAGFGLGGGMFNTAKAFLPQIAGVFGKELAINAAVEVPIQYEEYKQKEEWGIDYTIKDAMVNGALNSTVGAVFGTGLAGVTYGAGKAFIKEIEAEDPELASAMESLNSDNVTDIDAHVDNLVKVEDGVEITKTQQEIEPQPDPKTEDWGVMGSEEKKLDDWGASREELRRNKRAQNKSNPKDSLGESWDIKEKDVFLVKNRKGKGKFKGRLLKRRPKKESPESRVESRTEPETPEPKTKAENVAKEIIDFDPAARKANVQKIKETIRPSSLIQRNVLDEDTINPSLNLTKKEEQLLELRGKRKSKEAELEMFEQQYDDAIYKINELNKKTDKELRQEHKQPKATPAEIQELRQELKDEFLDPDIRKQWEALKRDVNRNTKHGEKRQFDEYTLDAKLELRNEAELEIQNRKRKKEIVKDAFDLPSKADSKGSKETVSKGSKGSEGSVLNDSDFDFLLEEEFNEAIDIKKPQTEQEAIQAVNKAKEIEQKAQDKEIQKAKDQIKETITPENVQKAKEATKKLETESAKDQMSIKQEEDLTQSEIEAIEEMISCL